MRFENAVRFACAMAVLAGARPAPAAPEAFTVYGYEFASSANVQGQHNAYFMTKVTLYNPNSEQITVNAVLQTPTGVTRPAGQSIVLPAKSYKVYENFLQDVFGYTGGAGIGLLESTLSKGFVAVAEVYVQSANGRYSTPLTGLFTTDSVQVASNSSVSVVAGLSVTSSTRANFGCASSSPNQTVVHVLFNAFTNGVETAATSDLVIGPYGWIQQSVPIQGTDVLAFFSVTSGGGGSAEPGVSAATYCYGVSVDNTSNDGTDIVTSLVSTQ
jgi:hypothetical protein